MPLIGGGVNLICLRRRQSGAYWPVMRRGLMITVLLLAGQAAVWAQAKPVRLQVTKQSRETKKNDYRSDDGTYTRDWVTDDISYAAEIENIAAVTLAGAVIKWAVMVNPADNSAPRITEGEQIVTFAPRQKHSLRAEPLKVTGLRHRNLEGNVWWEHQDKLAGYIFEVYVSGQRVVVEEYPKDFRKTLENLLPDRWLPSAQGRRF
jgi:hypothetical protein